jgi:hypothetical protein
MKTSSKKSHAVKGGSAEANRLAIAILEVLAGVRSPGEAAAALAISLPRYYQLETRALDALVSACEPKPKGKQPSLEVELASLQRELERARRECARQQALVRIAQRSVGLKASPSAAGTAKSATAKSGQAAKRQRKRRPVVRALKAAEALREGARSTDDETVQQRATEAAPSGKQSAR